MNLIILLEEDFINEKKVRLSGRRLKHILDVHRAKVGDNLRVGILNGKIGLGTITHMNDEFLDMDVELTEDPPKPSNVQLILAMPRPKVFKRLIQDISTMGIKKIYIIKTWRVEKSFWNSPVLEEENLFENSARMGQLLKKRLEEVKEKHPSVGDVRSIGLFSAIELVKDRQTKEPLAPWNGPDPGIMGQINKFLSDKGIYIYLRWNYMFIAPPIAINEQELNLGMDAVDESLNLADEFIKS